MASAVARAYNGSLRAEPSVGSRGKAPGQGVRGKLKAFASKKAKFWHLLTHESNFFTVSTFHIICI